jgi:predicted RNase H-like HicB family nuclease
MSTQKLSNHGEIITAFGRKFACCLEREPSGRYRAICHDFPGTVAFGATLDEARAHMRGELNFWLDAAYPPEAVGYSTDLT